MPKFILLLLCLCFSKSLLAQMDTEKLNALCEKSIVTIKTASAGSQGTGFVINSSGYLISNHHVISNRYGYVVQDAVVSFKDGAEYKAQIIDYDQNLDLALLKINANEALPALPVLEDLPKEGAEVITIGNGIGAGFALSRGVISTLNSQITDAPLHCLQTTTTINPGNSGGALINKNGLVVGVVVAKYIQKGVEGVGLAIKNTYLTAFLRKNGIAYITTPLISDIELKEARKLTAEEEEAEKQKELTRLRAETEKEIEKGELEKRRQAEQYAQKQDLDKLESEKRKQIRETELEAQRTQLLNDQENKKLAIEREKLRIEDEKKYRIKEKKERRLLLPYRVSLKIGGGVQHLFNNVLQFTSITPAVKSGFGYEPQNIMPIGSAMLAYRFNIKKEGKKERGNSIGAFANYGFLSTTGLKQLYQTNVNTTLPNGDLKPFQAFYEIEGGGLIREWLRLSGGVGTQFVDGQARTTSLAYYTATTGLIARFGLVEFDFIFTGLFGGFYQSPSARANITLNLHFKGIK